MSVIDQSLFAQKLVLFLTYFLQFIFSIRKAKTALMNFINHSVCNKFTKDYTRKLLISNSQPMQLNPKLIQYSLEMKYCQSKIIQDQHNQHLKKLQEIQRKSHLSKIKRQTQSLKNISQSMNRYHEISRTFKSKQNQQKRSYQDLKMIKSVSQIHKKKQNPDKVHEQHNQTYVQFKKRKENHKKIVQILKSKQLQEQNIKIGLRIARQENDFSYVDKIKNEIKEYTKAKHNLMRIRDEVSNPHISKKASHKVKAIKLLTQADDLSPVEIKRPQRRKTQPKIKTEVGCEEDSEEFLYEMLKKNPSQILVQRTFQNKEVQKVNKQVISLPQIKNHSKDQHATTERSQVKS